MSNDRVPPPGFPDDGIPPTVHHRPPPPPPLSADRRVTEAREELGRALKEGLNRIADSLNNALSGSRITGRVLRELGVRERKNGVPSHLDGTGYSYRFRSGTPVTWVDALMAESFEVTAQSPELDDPSLDDALTQLATTTVSWLKDRERRRAERDRERLSDLAEHGYDRTEGPQ